MVCGHCTDPERRFPDEGTRMPDFGGRPSAMVNMLRCSSTAVPFSVEVKQLLASLLCKRAGRVPIRGVATHCLAPRLKGRSGTSNSTLDLPH